MTIISLITASIIFILFLWQCGFKDVRGAKTMCLRFLVLPFQSPYCFEPWQNIQVSDFYFKIFFEIYFVDTADVISKRIFFFISFHLSSLYLFLFFFNNPLWFDYSSYILIVISFELPSFFILLIQTYFPVFYYLFLVTCMDLAANFWFDYYFRIFFLSLLTSFYFLDFSVLHFRKTFLNFYIFAKLYFLLFKIPRWTLHS